MTLTSLLIFGYFVLSKVTQFCTKIGLHLNVLCCPTPTYISSNDAFIHRQSVIYTHTHTRPFNGPFPGLPGWAGTRKVKPIWIILKQETVSGSGISSAICKSALRSRQITTPAPHRSVFYRPDALPAAQPTASKHWRHNLSYTQGEMTSQNLWSRNDSQFVGITWHNVWS